MDKIEQMIQELKMERGTAREEELVKALGEARDPRAVEVLVDHISGLGIAGKGEDTYFRTNPAISALINIGKTGVPKLIEIFEGIEKPYLRVFRWDIIYILELNFATFA